MSKVYFCNSEPIDLNAIAIMGVSVKTGDSPIGYFGTGLKFSIATLLRTGHEITLVRGGEPIHFTAAPEIIRGERFSRVIMGDQALGFTTQLGRNWEPWQAYRELYCNCLDESGIVADSLPQGDWGTIFVVDGVAIFECHKDRRKIFLSTAPLSATDECEIHDGETAHAFYRGVRAHKHGGVSILTYNILEDLILTEDRTVRDSWMVDYYAERTIARCDDEDLIERALMAERHTFEGQLSYSAAGKPSLAFMDVAFRLRSNMNCNKGALKLWEKHSDVRLTYDEASLDNFDEEQIEQAIKLVSRLGCTIDRRDFMVVESLGASIFGTVRSSRILISKATLDLGVRFVASTLYEEWLHKTQSLKDESRALQNLLFEKLMAMTERVASLERKGESR